MDDRRLRLVVQQVLRRTVGRRTALVSLQGTILSGGISAESVVAVLAVYEDAAGDRGVLDIVVKELRGAARREAAIYRALGSRQLAFAPRVLAFWGDAGVSILAMERIAAAERWPWRNTARAEAVLRVAAELHAATLACAGPRSYEDELCAVALETVDAVAAAGRSGAMGIHPSSLRAARRLVGAVSAIRREVVSGGPFPPTFIHGDLHSGNVVLARRRGLLQPVFLDWGRARIGSPLEDVASWVQSLGCWEPEARLRHDTLVMAYLRARGCTALSPRVRQSYWLAGASNAFAGALLHQLGIAASRSAPPAARGRALRVVHDWLRIIRRAEAMWLEAEREPRGARGRRTRPPRVELDPTPTP